MAIVFEFVKIVLASARLSEMISLERGPYNLFGRLRNSLEDSNTVVAQEIRMAIDCPYCLSIWVAAILILISHNRLGQNIIDMFAVSKAVTKLWETDE